MALSSWLGKETGSPRTRCARELRGVYLDVRRIAIQLRRHAEHAPYPALVAELRTLAAAAEEHAATLAAEIRTLAGNADPADAMAPRTGRNHWERLTVDLQDLEALRRRETELALRWDVDFPATTATLARLAHTTAAMTATVRDMLARSDPHAGS